MLNFNTFAFAAAVAAMIAAVPAQAQFAGAPLSVTSVKALIDQGKDDQWAALEGNIVKQIRHDKYLFNDGTAELIVEIDDKVFRGQRVDPNTKVRLEGEFERDFMEKDEFEVKTLTIVR